MHKKIFLLIIALLAIAAGLFCINVGHFTDRQHAEAVQTDHVIRFVDPDGQSVPGVRVSVCSGDACTMLNADENGVARFTGAPGDWSAQILKTPDGFTFSEGEKLPLEEDGETVIVLSRES